MPSLANKLKKMDAKVRKSPKIPLWKGPMDDGPLGGITQSMLSSFMCCPERFRVRHIIGLSPDYGWNHKSGYGHLWHLAKEHWSSGEDWIGPLQKEAAKFCIEYKEDQKIINHWYNVCKLQFSIYAENYDDLFPSIGNTQPLTQEEVFKVPYELPSGRVVYLRGKFDGVDLLKSIQSKTLLIENKTKGDVDSYEIEKQLAFDLQTMFYLTCVKKIYKKYPIQGVIYNVVRRPLSGGKGTIRKHKPSKKNPQGETDVAFYARLKKIIEEDLENFFSRWEVEVTDTDLREFELTFLIPQLERLCDWYSYMELVKFDPWKNPQNMVLNHIHYRHPYGIYNAINERGAVEIDSYLETGSTVGLVNSKLFNELEE